MLVASSNYICKTRSHWSVAAFENFEIFQQHSTQIADAVKEEKMLSLEANVVYCVLLFMLQ